MTEPAHHRVVPDVPPTRRTRQGEWGITTTLASLLVLAGHFLWWTYVRMFDAFDPDWGIRGPHLSDARESVSVTTNWVTVVAMVLVVVVPVLAWVWRRSPVWPPVVVTVLAIVTTWVLTYDAVAQFQNPSM